MVIITLETILNETVGFHLRGDPIIFCYEKKQFHIRNDRKVVMNIFIRSSRDPRKKTNDPHGVRDPRLKTTLV